MMSESRKKCVCGEPTTLGVVHRVDLPCYLETRGVADETKGSTDINAMGWKCKARNSNLGAALPPDCDWPLCGCDPYADNVITALQESGYLPYAGETDCETGVLCCGEYDTCNRPCTPKGRSEGQKEMVERCARIGRIAQLEGKLVDEEIFAVFGAQSSQKARK